MSIRVRTMEPGDVDFAVGLTATEGWGYSPQDFRRLMNLDPGGCFVALDGDRRVGVTTLTSYGKVAWIGSVIVDPRLRSKGIGRALMEAALAYADRTEVETCRLNAYLHVIPFYDRLGFRPEFENIRFVGSAPGNLDAAVERARPALLPALASFDEPYFGADRRRLLEALYHDYGRGFLVARRGQGIRGYIVGGSSTEGVEVGPWVCDPSEPEVPGTLFSAVLALADGKPLALSAPTPNARALEIIGEHRLAESFRTLRMFRGRRAHGGDPRGYFALGGLEKG